MRITVVIVTWFVEDSPRQESLAAVLVVAQSAVAANLTAVSGYAGRRRLQAWTPFDVEFAVFSAVAFNATVLESDDMVDRVGTLASGRIL